MEQKKHLIIAHSWDREFAIIETKKFVAEAGFSETDQAMIATVAAELSTNILRYAGKGDLFLGIEEKEDRVGIEIIALDQGTGIEDVEKALQDHYTTTKDSLGLGLPSVKRIMDDFEIESSLGKGTRVIARKWRKIGKNRLSFGFSISSRSE